MVAHLVGAWSTYRGIRIRLFYLSLSYTHSHTPHKHVRTHTHTLQIHALPVMGWYNEKKMTDQYAERDMFSVLT